MGQQQGSRWQTNQAEDVFGSQRSQQIPAGMSLPNTHHFGRLRQNLLHMVTYSIKKSTQYSENHN